MFGFIKPLFGSSTAGSTDSLGTVASSPSINPATGLPMIDGCGSVDVGGNPFGTDLFSDLSSGPDIGSFDWGSDSGSSFDSFGSNWD